MKGFYDTAPASPVPPARTADDRTSRAVLSPETVAPGGSASDKVRMARGARARIAIYDAMTSSPRVEDLAADDPRAFIETLSERTYSLARERGGRIPYTVVREVAENLLHASFRDVVVSILDDGSTIRFSDRGPGITDKDRAFLPGFTTADDSMRHFIRGVGSGLPIVRESVGFSGGLVEIEDNLDSGTVVTVTVPSAPAPASVPAIFAQPRPVDAAIPASAAATATDLDFSSEGDDTPTLGTRQKHVLSLVMEMGSLGPTIVSRELGVGLSTAYRDLAFLEEAGLLRSDESGKRMLTKRGVAYLDSLMN